MLKNHCRWLLFASLPLLAGCSTLDLNLSNFGREPADQTMQVTEMVCLWEPGEGVGLDGLPTRGFAGQILFFARGQAEPVRINGDVRIYVFDDQGSAEEQAKPMHEFEFPAEVWNTYLQKTNLGAAYQLFIPYTRKGGNLANCAVRVRMTAESRLPLYSKLANVTLPGRRASSEQHSLTPELTATPAERSSAQPSIAEMAAIQKASAEFGLGRRSDQFQRLESAARNAVQTADYIEESTTTDDGGEFADQIVEPPVSRRYRMSSGSSRQ